MADDAPWGQGRAPVWLVVDQAAATKLRRLANKGIRLELELDEESTDRVDLTLVDESGRYVRLGGRLVREWDLIEEALPRILFAAEELAAEPPGDVELDLFWQALEDRLERDEPLNDEEILGLNATMKRLGIRRKLKRPGPT